MKSVRVVGIDPGSILCGYGVIELSSRKEILYIASGTIRAKRTDPLDRRLKTLYEDLCSVLKEYAPEEAAIEKVFFAKGIKAALNLGHARGVVLLALAEAGIKLNEYSANEVKKAVVGYGKAEKRQVQEMIRAILSLPTTPPPDSADALALALCHLNMLRY